MALTSYLRLAHRIFVKGGDGGMGKICSTKNTRSGMRRPDGGNGGNGGDVILRKSSLYADFDHLPEKIDGVDGDVGKYGGCRGANGTDKTLLIPKNAIVTFNDEIIPNFPLIAKGGRGRAGNHSSLKPNVKTSINDGESYSLHMKLEKYVDFALIGPPNAGKTTLTNLLCGTNFKTSFVPGNTEKPNIGALKPAVSKISEMADEEHTVGDFPGGFDVAYLYIFKHALAISKGIIVVSDDHSLQAHLGLVDALNKLSSDLTPRIAGLVRTKIDRECPLDDTKEVYYSGNGLPVFSVSAVNGDGLLGLLNAMSNFSKTQG